MTSWLVRGADRRAHHDRPPRPRDPRARPTLNQGTGKIRAQFPATAVVLVTADRTVPPQISMQPGVVAYLAKPFAREDVVDAVKLAVGWHGTAVTDPQIGKPRAALTKEWVGPSGT